MDNDVLNEIAKAGEEVLAEVRQKFIDADLAFLDRAEKHDVNPVTAFIALIALHRAAADQMEERLIEMLAKTSAAKPKEE